MTIRIARAAIVRHFEGGLSLTGTAIQFGLEPNRHMTTTPRAALRDAPWA